MNACERAAAMVRDTWTAPGLEERPMNYTVPVEQWAEEAGFKRPDGDIETGHLLWDDILVSAKHCSPEELPRYVMIFLRQALDRGGWHR